MSRAQWEDSWSVAPQKYGLGTISGTFDGWDWFGHSGGFQGYVTRSAVVPEHDLSLSCLTNAVDGMSHLWLEGALAILKRFKEDGAPSGDLAGWAGRWWSVWGANDLVPVGDKVLIGWPSLANPVAKAAELTVTGPDTARISQAGAFANYGEPARLIRGADGAVVAVQIAGGRMIAEADLAQELIGRYER
jgi:D-alanyl-D-alanine carboxypeptidase